MKRILIFALVLLCGLFFAKAEDDSLKADDDDFGLENTPNPYMQLTDKYTGKLMNVWTSWRKDGILYHVDYPWIVRVPEKLEKPIGPIKSPRGCPPVDGGYYLYGGAYLASEPQRSLEQVEKELKKRGIENPQVCLITPRITILFSSLEGVQFLGYTEPETNENNVFIKHNAPLDNLVIAVPAKDKEIFEKMFEEGNLHLQRKILLVFKSNEQPKITLSPEEKENLKKALSEDDYEKVLTRLESLKWTQGIILRSFTSTPCILPDHGLVKEVKVLTQQGDYASILRGNGVRIRLNRENERSVVKPILVKVTYMNGQEEYYEPPTLPQPGKTWDNSVEKFTRIVKVYGTISLRYERDNETGEYAVIATDLLYDRKWLTGENRTERDKMEAELRKEIEKELIQKAKAEKNEK